MDKDKEMDFTIFINSRDIKAFQREICHQVYDSLEAAWLVWQCDHVTLKEKHEAWEWIIENMPDQIIDKGKKGDLKGYSLHKVLQDYMNMQNDEIERLFKADEEDAYTFTECVFNGELCDYRPSGKYFNSYSDCVSDIFKRKSYDSNYRFYIKSVNAFAGKVYEEYLVCLSASGEILDINCPLYNDNQTNYPDKLAYFFKDVYLTFYVPFRLGDVICHKDEGAPMVLTDIVFPDDYDGMQIHNINKNGDGHDMKAWGFMADEKEPETKMIWTYRYNYMDMEYYKGELDNPLLKAMAKMLYISKGWLSF